MILLIDNYDSFTFNLFQMLSERGAKVKVVRNDAITVAQARRLKPRGIVISPGPGNPDESGVSLALLKELSPEVPTLGVCLGHQALGQVYGAKVVRAKKLMHGKSSLVKHDGRGVFRGLPREFEVARYHSLVVDPRTVGRDLVVSARTDGNVVMGLRHRRFPIEGVQFHPESVMTPEGGRLLENFLKGVRA